MKKLILFLLLSIAGYGQTTTGQEQEFDYGIKNNSTQTITTPPYLTTTGVDGTQGKIPSALIEKTANKQNSLAVDGTGTKYPTVDAVNAALPRNYTKVVYVNSTNPSTATIFDDENYPVVNDDLLKSDVANLYIGTDASPWVWNGSTYETKVVPASSNFFVEGTTVDAGSNKNVNIQRVGSIKTSQSITAQNMNSSSVTANVVTVNPETPNTIAYFDSQKQIKSLSTDTYPSLTELSYVKGVTSGFQAQINGKADLDGSGKVPLSQINDALLGSVNYKGTYNATTNVPAIPTATGSNKGWYYIISTAGAQQGFNFVNGDWIISNGTSWGKVDNNNTVTSVNGQAGAVSVTASSIGAQTTLTNPTTGVGSQNDPSTYALQDGTILYHSTKWFVPTGTVSTSGATVTSVGTQFTSGMVGAKLTINGEWRIITAYTSSTAVTVASAYSQNYSGVVAGSWGVYSKAYESSGIVNANIGTSIFYNFTGSAIIYVDQNGNYRVNASYALFYKLEPSSSLHLNNGVNFGLSRDSLIRWASTTNGEAGAKDLGLRRNTAGVLEIYDGVTADGVVGNRRDLLARNITATNYIGSATLTGTPTAPTAAPGTTGNQIATLDYVQAAKQDFQSVLENGNITTLPFYSETDFGGGNNYKTGVLPITGFPFPVNGTSVENTGKITTIGIAASENGGFFVKKEGTVDSFLGFHFPDKSNPSYPAPTPYTLATTDDFSKRYTVSSLPTPTGSEPVFAIVTDATAPTYLGALTGGGSVVCPVFYNGTAWVAH